MVVPRFNLIRITKFVRHYLEHVFKKVISIDKLFSWISVYYWYLINMTTNDYNEHNVNYTWQRCNA